MNILIENAYIITMDPHGTLYPRGNIYIEDDRIVAVGKPNQVSQKKYSPEIVIDGNHKAVLPGLINTHAHFFQTLLKSLGDDRDLFSWLGSTTQPAARNFTSKDMYHASMLTCLESIRSGITTTCDMQYLHTSPDMTEQVLQAVNKTGIRGIISRQNSDFDRFSKFPRKHLPHWETLETFLHNTEVIHQKWHGKNNNRIQVWAGPNTLYSASDELISKISDWSTRKNVRQVFHLSETQWEYQQVKKHMGVTPLRALFNIDPRAVQRGVMVHSVWMDPEDIQLLQREGGTVSHCPISNMYLGSGIAPIPEMLHEKIPVSLGTDGAASNNSNNGWEMLKITALLHKVNKRDATIITANQVLQMGTCMGAEAMGLSNQIGSIEVGKQADVILIDLDSLNYHPINNVPSQLVYCGQAENIDSVIIAGELIMKNKKFININIMSVLEDAQNAAIDLQKRISEEDRK